MQNEIWIEKYRPKNFNEMIGHDLKKLEDSLNNLPNLLLISKSPGTGKTSIAKIIIHNLKAEYLSLNAGDSRGIDTIRNKVKDFAMTVAHNNQQKIVFLDEAGDLTREAQRALLNMIETYHKNCRFILTANHRNKIDDALASRCMEITLQNPDPEEVFPYLKNISQKENLILTDQEIKDICDIYYPDIRKMVNKLQEFSITHNKEALLNPQLSGDSAQMIELLKKGIFLNFREFCLTHSIDHDNTIIEIHNQLMTDENINDFQKLQIALSSAKYIKFANIVISKDILFESFGAEVIKILKNA